MIRSNLIKSLRNAADLSQKEATAILDVFFEEMAETLAKGERVKIQRRALLMSENIRLMQKEGGTWRP